MGARAAAARRFAVVAASWLLAAAVCDLLLTTPVGAAVWLPPGVALAALLFGCAPWPALLGTAFAAAVFLLAQGEGPARVAVATAAGVAAPALAWWLLRASARGRASPWAMDRLVLAAIPAAAAGAAAAVLLGEPAWSAWAAHYAGMVLATPLAWAATTTSRRVFARPWRLVEAVLLAAALVAVAHEVFGEHPPGAFRVLPYAVLPALVWAALRFGVAGSALAVLAVAREALDHAVAGGGPLVRAGEGVAPSIGHTTLQLQIFVVCIGVSVLLLAHVLEARARSVAALRAAEAALQREHELSRRAEAAAHESEERYRGLFEDSPTVMLVLDPESGRVADANPAACAFYGRSRDEMQALRIHDINVQPDGEVQAFLGRACEGPGLRQAFRHRLASGETRDVFVYSGLVCVGPKRLLHSVVHDVTEARRAEAAALAGLREASATLQGVIEATPLAAVTFDARLRVRLVNPAGVEIFERAAHELFDLPAAELLDPEHVDEILAPALAGRPVVGVAFERRRADGTPVALRAFAGPLWGASAEAQGVVALFEDATERRMMEETFQLAQKLEVLATVAGGVAHDFNNLLTVVLGYTERALRRLPDESPARPHLGRALPALEQAIALAGKMLTYAGGSRPTVGPLDLASLLRDDSAVLEAAVPSHVTLQLDLPPTAPAIEASAEEIRQTVTALLANAVEAIGGRRGRIRLRVGPRRLVEADQDFSRHTGQPTAAGEYVSLEVQDDGSGIRAEDLTRIFDPFFTTKFVGRGLGLAAVLGIVRSHRGGVAVDSAPGWGTRFELVFPVLDPAAALAQATAAEA